MDKFSVVCWLWGDRYTTKHINVLHESARRFLPEHDFYCVTDRTEGFAPGVNLIPLWDDRPKLQRRLRIFSREFSKIVGNRILQIDIDCLLVGDIGADIIETETAMTVWKSTSVGRHGYALNPSFIFFKADQMRFIWDAYERDPQALHVAARDAGWTGNDQAAISYFMHDKPYKALDASHGFYSYRDHDCKTLPANARLVGFFGPYDQADQRLQAEAPWIKDHWPC